VRRVLGWDSAMVSGTNWDRDVPCDHAGGISRIGARDLAGESSTDTTGDTITSVHTITPCIRWATPCRRAQRSAIQIPGLVASPSGFTRQRVPEGRSFGDRRHVRPGLPRLVVLHFLSAWRGRVSKRVGRHAPLQVPLLGNLGRAQRRPLHSINDGKRSRKTLAGSTTKPSGPNVTEHASKNPDCPHMTAVP